MKNELAHEISHIDNVCTLICAILTSLNLVPCPFHKHPNIIPSDHHTFSCHEFDVHCANIIPLLILRVSYMPPTNAGIGTLVALSDNIYMKIHSKTFMSFRLRLDREHGGHLHPSLRKVDNMEIRLAVLASGLKPHNRN